VELFPLDSALGAAASLEKGVVDAAVGLHGGLFPWVLQNKGEFLESTADVPHLVASVLVARGSFVARYPEVVLRVLRGVFELEQNMGRYRKRIHKGFRQKYPQLLKPEQLLQEEPLASLEENLAFFGLQGHAAVSYAELYQSTVALASKLYERPPAPGVEESLELTPLKRLAKLQ
jgi:ABC-type nitrate/sulfonate/bicarbonate transport system substrate-binding protein